MRLSVLFGIITLFYGCSNLPDKEELALSGLYYGYWIDQGEVNSKSFVNADMNSVSCNKAIIAPVFNRYLIFGNRSKHYLNQLEEYRKSLEASTHGGSYSVWSVPYAMNLLSAIDQASIDFEDQFELVVKTTGSVGFYSGVIDSFRYFDGAWSYWFDNFDVDAYQIGYRYLVTSMVPVNNRYDNNEGRYVFIYRDMGSDDRSMCKETLRAKNFNGAIGSFLSIDTDLLSYSAYFYQVNVECEIVKVNRYDFDLIEGNQLLTHLKKVFKKGYQQCLEGIVN